MLFRALTPSISLSSNAILFKRSNIGGGWTFPGYIAPTVVTTVPGWEALTVVAVVWLGVGGAVIAYFFFFTCLFPTPLLAGVGAALVNT